MVEIIEKCELCHDTGWVLNEYGEAKKCDHRKPIEDYKEKQYKDPREPGEEG